TTLPLRSLRWHSMSSGRSSSEPLIPSRRARRSWIRQAALVPAAALLLAGIGSAQQALPPPPESGDATPTPTAGPTPAGPRMVICPRCGYRCDPTWHYCVACGWDLTTLEGEAE